MEHGVERRKFPRHGLADGSVVARPISMAVRLLDISERGVLLASPDPLYAGASTRVVARLGAATLEAQLLVRHASNRWETQIGGYRAGGQFTWVSPLGRTAIGNLLTGIGR